MGDELPDIARQAIVAGLDLVRWDQEMAVVDHGIEPGREKRSGPLRL